MAAYRFLWKLGPIQGKTILSLYALALLWGYAMMNIIIAFFIIIDPLIYKYKNYMSFILEN